jgi:subtilisin family serine protease
MSSVRIGLRLTAVAAMAVFAFACADGPTQAPPVEPPDFSVAGFEQPDLSDQYLVMFRGKGVPSGFARDVEKLGGNVVFSHDVGIAVVNGLDEAGAGALGGKKYVSEIQMDEAFDLDPMWDASNVVLADAIGSPDDPTTAARYARQWNMRAIDADDAWAAGRLGSPNVTIAILDTGIDYTYPDLAGLVDLSRSASFVPFDDFLVSIFFPGKHPVTDLYWHGTHVAATASSNAVALAGVTSKTTLIGVKVCDVFGSCAFSSVIAGLLHAVDNGADVANMSLGGAFTKAGSKGAVGFINKVFNYAKNKGMTIVVSAGNEGADLDHNGNTYATYCDTPATICVSATGPTSGGSSGPWTDVDNPAPYTNFGNSAINVAAPGGTGPAGAWVWSACSQTSLVIPICQTGFFILGANGTSMAAPHVTGVASLVIEDIGRRPGRVKTIMQQSADDLGKKGNDPIYGKGRLNAAAAVGLD